MNSFLVMAFCLFMAILLVSAKAAFIADGLLSSVFDVFARFFCELVVHGGRWLARGLTRDRGLQPGRASPNGRVLAADGNFGTLLPRFMTAYGRLLIPEGSQALAAYGY